MSTKRGDPRGTRAYKARRLEVLQRDQWTCFYCQMPATTVDHVIPIIAGGDPLSYENLVSSCTSCNSRKGSRNQGSFLAHTPTPPVFLKPSLPETIRTVPDSPFNKPDTLDFDAK
jgi:5-methylcytosine-specific restriction endonuclease McrA